MGVGELIQLSPRKPQENTQSDGPANLSSQKGFSCSLGTMRTLSASPRSLQVILPLLSSSLCVCEHLDARRQPWLALFSSAWDLLTRLNWMPSEPPGSSWPHFLCVGVTGTHCCSQLFTWVLGIELWSSGWHCKGHFPRHLGCVPAHHCDCGVRSHMTPAVCMVLVTEHVSWLPSAGKQVGVSSLQRRQLLT